MSRRACVSIHAPRAGRDAQVQHPDADGIHVSIHAPRAGRDRGVVDDRRREREVSIHAPRAGRDTRTTVVNQSFNTFQSTRPVRGATSGPSSCCPT